MGKDPELNVAVKPFYYLTDNERVLLVDLLERFLNDSVQYEPKQDDDVELEIRRACSLGLKLGGHRLVFEDPEQWFGWLACPRHGNSCDGMCEP